MIICVIIFSTSLFQPGFRENHHWRMFELFLLTFYLRCYKFYHQPQAGKFSLISSSAFNSLSSKTSLSRRNVKILHRPKVAQWRNKDLTQEQIHAVVVIAVLFRSRQSLPSCCPAHTLLPRSPDSLMLLCEFSSPLFLDPRFGRETRGEGRGDRRVDRQGEGWGRTGRVAMMPR